MRKAQGGGVELGPRVEGADCQPKQPRSIVAEDKTQWPGNFISRRIHGMEFNY